MSGGGSGYPAVVAIPTRTGSSADQEGAELAVQQVDQGFPVVGGRFGGHRYASASSVVGRGKWPS